MSTVYEIPLNPNPQVFTIALGNTSYQLTVQWREALGGGWILDIADRAGVPIIQGIPLVTGANLLAQYAYLGIEGELRVQTDHAPDEVPTFENLGITSHLYFVVS